MQLRLTGEGGGGLQGGPAGDLYVLVRIAEHELFARDGADLYCDIPVTFPDLALGAEIDVPVLNGKETLVIPAGTQPGEVVRLRGHGMPRLRERRRGDACYRLLLEVPRELNSKQREALEAYAAAGETERGPLSLSFLERMKKLFG
jgi:molecular chaperone DnaJ